MSTSTTTSSPTSLQTFLTDYSTRLQLSSASKILTLDEQTHAALTSWCEHNLSSTDRPKITPATEQQSTSGTAWPHPEAAYTHIFATLSPDLKASIKRLQGVHYSLLWKGVAVVLPPAEEGGKVGGEEVDLARLVDLGGFEPGKVRAVEVEGGRVCFAMKWDMLTA